MNNLNELIGQEVQAKVFIDEENYAYVDCKVISVNIESFHFEEKSEPIFITVDVQPTGEVPDILDDEDFLDIPLELITKS